LLSNFQIRGVWHAQHEASKEIKAIFLLQVLFEVTGDSETKWFVLPYDLKKEMIGP